MHGEFYETTAVGLFLIFGKRSMGQNTAELGYNVMKGTEYFVSL
jgi:hypothetical protein